MHSNYDIVVSDVTTQFSATYSGDSIRLFIGSVANAVPVLSVWSVVGGHVGYLVVGLATHAIVGYVLGLSLFGEPRAGTIGALLADIDLLFPATWGTPFVHRGITHTALAAGVAVAIGSIRGRSIAGAVGIGYVSQLLIDATTPKGVALAYPVSSETVVLPLRGHSPEATVVIWIACISIIWLHRSAED